MAQMIKFFVEDKPRPGGSKRAFIAGGRAIVVDASKKTTTWRNSVRFAARNAHDGEPITGALYMGVTFYLRRPKSHYGTGKNERVLKSSAPKCHRQKPDLTKLVRSTEDALKGICWHDDSQVDRRWEQKRWAHRWEREGAQVTIRAVTEVEAESAAQ